MQPPSNAHHSSRSRDQEQLNKTHAVTLQAALTLPAMLRCSHPGWSQLWSRATGVVELPEELQRPVLGLAHDPGHQQRLQSNREIFACQHTIDLMLGLRHKSKPCDDTKQCLIIKSAPDSRAHLFQIKGITTDFTGLRAHSTVFVRSRPGQSRLSSRVSPQP